MQIILTQDEIIKALDTYVRSQINIAQDQDIIIDLKAGRGENGYSATLDIVQSKPKTNGVTFTPAASTYRSPLASAPISVAQPDEPEDVADATDSVDEDDAPAVEEVPAASSGRSIFTKAKISA
jgi:hypothetical protein